MFNWIRDPNALWVLSGCVMLGACSGVLSSFAMLRRRSLLGDALAHAALPGICLAYLITGTRSMPVFMIGAFAAGLIGAFCVQAITRYSRIKEDTALGLVLSVFFAFGIVLLTLILHSSSGMRAGLDKFLFGQAATMVETDVKVMFTCAALVCLLAILFYKELKLLCFDPGFADGLGYPSTLLDGILNFFIVMVVIIGLQAVGVILIVALLITPAAAARFWTDRLGHMVWISGLVGAASGALGTFLSTLAPRMSTGPLIVLSATVMFLFSLFCAPKRGLIAKAIRFVRLRAKVARENILRTIYETAEINGAWNSSIPVPDLAARRSQAPHVLTRTLKRLEAEGLVQSQNGNVRVTETGLQEAYKIVRNHRLWEMYLMHEESIGADHVDRDADFIEHFLNREAVEELERLLHLHNRALTLPPSVHPISGTV